MIKLSKTFLYLFLCFILTACGNDTEPQSFINKEENDTDVHFEYIPAPVFEELEEFKEPEKPVKSKEFTLTGFCEYGAGVTDETMFGSYPSIVSLYRTGDENYWKKREGNNFYNVLMWDIDFAGRDFNVDVYRSRNGEDFEHIFRTYNSNFLIDEDVDEGFTYIYYLKQDLRLWYKDLNAQTSNKIKITPSAETTEVSSSVDEITAVWTDWNKSGHFFNTFEFTGDNTSCNYVSNDVILKFKNIDSDSDFSFTSFNEDVLSQNGKITRPIGKPVTAEYTLIIRNGAFTMRTDWKINVAPLSQGSNKLVYCIEDAWALIRSQADEKNIKLDEPDSELIFQSAYISDLSDDKYFAYFYFQQYYKGLNVGIYNSVSVNTYEEYHEDSIIGSSYLSDIHLDTIEPLVPFEEALETAKTVSDKLYIQPNLGDSCGNGRRNQLFIHITDEREPKLAWSTCAHSNEDNICSVIICALTGEILYIEPIHAM
ncbi:MAG: hypothetical protein FWG44_03910 [Oscillospiraceae bacterium]|nr:hypothetical protein [Oscillospiraceae bacterium]